MGYRRKPGTVVTYSPEQQVRYKSVYQRWVSAQDLRPSSRPSESVFRFLSERAPLGYWEVNVSGLS